jgi:hypothetical protein
LNFVDGNGRFYLIEVQITQLYQRNFISSCQVSHPAPFPDAEYSPEAHPHRLWQMQDGVLSVWALPVQLVLALVEPQSVWVAVEPGVVCE